jgi:segregation and condensation protein A
VVSIAHVHDVRVSVREHAALLRDRLRLAGTATFRVLCADCQSTLEVVARFLALLELYREGLVGFAQVQALGELTVRWTGGDDTGTDLEIDEYAGSPADAARPDAAAPPADADAVPAGAAVVAVTAAASGVDAVPSDVDVVAPDVDAVPAGADAVASDVDVVAPGADVVASGAGDDVEEPQ